MNKLSLQTLTKLNDVLNDIDNDLGNLCKIDIMQLNHITFATSIHTISLGNTNISLEIYDAIAEYKELEGIYDNFNDHGHFNIEWLETMLHRNYNNERFSSIYTYDTYYSQAGICKNCNEWKSDSVDVPINIPKSNMNDPHSQWGDSYDYCQACKISWTECKYYSTSVNHEDMLIYNSIKQTIAKFRLIRNTSSNCLTDFSYNIPLNIVI